MIKTMTGYTKCPKCGMTVYVWKDKGVCYLCGNIKIDRTGKNSEKGESNEKNV